MSATITLVITLPWPSPLLSPNARPKRRDKISATKAAREGAFWLTKEAMGRRRVASIALMRVLWCQPDRHARDDDNLVGRFKALRDGIAQALGVDDKTFRPTHDPDGPIVPGGQVVVTIEAVLT